MSNFPDGFQDDLDDPGPDQPVGSTVIRIRSGAQIMLDPDGTGSLVIAHRGDDGLHEYVLTFASNDVAEDFQRTLVRAMTDRASAEAWRDARRVTKREAAAAVVTRKPLDLLGNEAELAAFVGSTR